MISVFIALITLGTVDALDPYAISTLLLLLQLVRKDWHVLINVWANYLTYWLIAVLVYFGFLVHLTRFIETFGELNPAVIGLAQFAGGIMALLGAIVFTVRLFRNWSNLDRDISKVLFIKSVHPVFIALYGISQAVMNIPFLWPLYSFIAILAPRHLAPGPVILILGVFTLFSFLPLLAIYWLYRRLETSHFARIIKRVKLVLTRFMLIVIPLFLLVVCLWWIRGGLLKLMLAK